MPKLDASSDQHGCQPALLGADMEITQRFACDDPHSLILALACALARMAAREDDAAESGEIGNRPRRCRS